MTESGSDERDVESANSNADNRLLIAGGSGALAQAPIDATADQPQLRLWPNHPSERRDRLREASEGLNSTVPVLRDAIRLSQLLNPRGEEWSGRAVQVARKQLALLRRHATAYLGELRDALALHPESGETEQVDEFAKALNEFVGAEERCVRSLDRVREFVLRQPESFGLVGGAWTARELRVQEELSALTSESEQSMQRVRDAAERLGNAARSATDRH